MVKFVEDWLHFGSATTIEAESNRGEDGIVGWITSYPEFSSEGSASEEEEDYDEYPMHYD